MGVKPGYKMTEVGEIPEDWEVKPLGLLAFSVEYGSSAKSNIQGYMPVLRMGNLQDGKIEWKDLVYTSDESEIRKYILRPGDVLFNRTNTIDLVGKSSIYKGERPAIFAGYLIRINVDKSLLESRFLNYVLNTEFSKRHSAKVLSIAVGQANINGRKLQTYPIPIPPTLTEQEAIAEALSDVDALIESLEQLLAKKRQIKQGTMQELLTGKKRLPRFEVKRGYKQTEVGVIPEDWEVKHLGAIASYTNGRAHEGHVSNFGQYIVVNSKFVSTNGHIRKYSDRRLCPASRGDILMVMSDVPNGRAIAKCFLVDQNDLYTTNQRICVIRPFQIDGKLLFYKLNRNPFYLVFDDGVKQTNLRKSDVLSCLLAFPATLAEQEAIATILSDMDAELAALETKLAKAHDLKRGMMQNLLTGKIRLVKTTPASSSAA